MTCDRFVVDAWAILSWLQDEEPAARRMQDLLDRAEDGRIAVEACVLNLGEVFYITAKKVSMERATRVREVLRDLPIHPVSTSDELVWKAAEIKASYRVSYADAVAAALASLSDACFVTGDQEFRALEEAGILSVMWLNRGSWAGGRQ